MPYTVIAFKGGVAKKGGGLMDISLMLIGFSKWRALTGVFAELPFSLFHQTGVAITMHVPVHGWVPWPVVGEWLAKG